MRVLKLLPPLAALSLGLGCSEETSAKLRLPEGLSCSAVLHGGPEASTLQAALDRAQAGECVVAAAGTYSSALTVPSGVSLAAEVGTPVTVQGDSTQQAAVTLAPGAGLFGIRVASLSMVGVLIDRGPAEVSDVHVEGASAAALVAWCEEDCREDLLSHLHDVELTASPVGLVVHGARVALHGGRVAGSRKVNLESGYGVVASHGGYLEMEGTIVEQNEGLGILIDGAQGTAATLKTVSVLDNGGRGVWVQSLQGTAQAPKVRLDACVIERNQLVGVGARASQGLEIRGGRIASTKSVKVLTDVGQTTDVGDGIGLFAGTGAIQVQDVELAHNQRSQVLVDTGATGIVLERATVLADGAELGVLVQRTQETVQAPSAVVVAPGNELAFSAPQLSVPTGR